jgi:hypothetical protein
MLDRSTGSLRILYDPLAVLFLQRVRDLHSRARRASGLGLKFHLRLRLISLDGHINHVHIHRAQIYRFQGNEMLIDASSNAIRIAFLLLASGEENQQSYDR